MSTHKMPPAAWGSGADLRAIGVVPSPPPAIERTGWSVTITGVRFAHMHHCPLPACRTALFVATEGGTIRLGFHDTGRHEGKCYETKLPGGRFSYHGDCPNCHKPIDLRPNPRARRDPYPGNPAGDIGRLVTAEWQQLRDFLEVHTVDMTRADIKRCQRYRTKHR